MKFKLKRFLTREAILHEGFELGLLLKGINSLLEVLGGILVVFISPEKLQRFLAFITREELIEDPKDKWMHLLLKFGSDFSVSSQHFVVYYLLSHGIIKIILVLLLYKKKLWAYPLAILSLVLFIIYQLYRFSYTHSVFLILLTLFDILMIFLTWIEFKRILSSKPDLR